MRRSTFVNLAIAQTTWLALKPIPTEARPATTSSVVIEHGRFVIGGKPVLMRSGEMHYPRVPREHWRNRMEMARAMGLNALCTYVFWNLHEPHPGVYDFADEKDVAEYVRIAGELGLHVILRPGPYVCAEWDFGGYPAWLLKDPQTVVRSRDPRYQEAARRWLRRLGQELAAAQMPGGPIVAVQVENEYGSFGDDHEYMRLCQEALSDAGFDHVPQFTADGVSELPNGTLPDIHPAVNSGDPQHALPALLAFRPSALQMCTEYYPGWFDHWGEPHHLVSSDGPVADLDWMISKGYSFNLYMFHGGTTFGYMNGANYSGSDPYQPTTTSYDYDAPLSESGVATPKYHALRQVIAKHLGALPAIPRAPRHMAIVPFDLDETASLGDLLTSPIREQTPRFMEAYGQSYGYIAYRTTVSGTTRRVRLDIGAARDYVVVLLNGQRAGTLDRRLRERVIELDVPAGVHALTLLVENTGRINYGRELVGERKGLIDEVSLDGKPLKDWEIFTLPMDDLSSLRFKRGKSDVPAFFRGTFHVRDVADTYLDVRMLGKGVLWVNGRNAGRFWSIGPQYALYVPGSWMNVGSNEVVAFDLLDRSERRLNGRTGPLFAPIEE